MVVPTSTSFAVFLTVRHLSGPVSVFFVVPRTEP